jgi:hypothetical protein
VAGVSVGARPRARDRSAGTSRLEALLTWAAVFFAADKRPAHAQPPW